MEEKWKYNCKVDLRNDDKPESKLIIVANGRIVIKLSFCEGKKSTMNIWALENNTKEDIRFQIELDKSYIIDVKQLSIESDFKKEYYDKNNNGIKVVIPKRGTKIKHKIFSNQFNKINN